MRFDKSGVIDINKHKYLLYKGQTAMKKAIQRKTPNWILAAFVALIVGVTGGHYLFPAQAASFNMSSAYGCSLSHLPVLAEGSTGGCVKLAQRWLDYWGYGLSIDGDFGPKTRAAVIAFQKRRHIGVDGVIGPQTWSYLNAI
jgi:murein L,D-transpeptidase YcbB/YkuD